MDKTFIQSRKEARMVMELYLEGAVMYEEHPIESLLSEVAFFLGMTVRKLRQAKSAVTPSARSQSLYAVLVPMGGQRRSRR